MNPNIAINREKFRKEILPRRYSPFFHIGFNFLVLTGSIIFCLLNIKNWDGKEISLFAGFVTFNSLVVYLNHRYPMHHRYKFLKAYYWFHTQQHHNLFNEDDSTVRDFRDIYMILFPPSLVGFFAFVYVPALSYGLYYFTDSQLAFLFALSIYSYFLLYEVIHLASHSNETNWWYKIPGISKMFWHHRKHHDPKIMNENNFNIVLPIWDYIFRSKL